MTAYEKMKYVSVNIGSFYDELIACNFTEKQAIKYTYEFLCEIVGKNFAVGWRKGMLMGITDTELVMCDQRSTSPTSTTFFSK